MTTPVPVAVGEGLLTRVRFLLRTIDIIDDDYHATPEHRVSALDILAAIQEAKNVRAALATPVPVAVGEGPDPEFIEAERFVRRQIGKPGHFSRWDVLALAELDRLRAATPEPTAAPERYDGHEFYADPENREAGRCDYTYPDGEWCGEPVAFHWHEKAAPVGAGLREARAMVSFVLSTARYPSDHPIVAARRELIEWFDRAIEDAAPVGEQGLDVDALALAMAVLLDRTGRNPNGLWSTDAADLAAEYARLRTPEGGGS